MTLTLDHLATRPAARRLLPALDRPAAALTHVGPNWFAAVMGTGIIANAAVTLPTQVAGQRGLALVVWLGAVVLLAATTAH